MEKPSFVRTLFGKLGVTLDIERLVIAGHSFGGITALQMGIDQKSAAVVSLDPWYAPVQKNILKENNYYLDHGSPPTLIIHTTKFPEAREKFMGKQED